MRRGWGRRYRRSDWGRLRSWNNVCRPGLRCTDRLIFIKATERALAGRDCAPAQCGIVVRDAVAMGGIKRPDTGSERGMAAVERAEAVVVNIYSMMSEVRMVKEKKISVDEDAHPQIDQGSSRNIARRKIGGRIVGIRPFAVHIRWIIIGDIEDIRVGWFNCHNTILGGDGLRWR